MKTNQFFNKRRKECLKQDSGYKNIPGAKRSRVQKDPGYKTPNVLYSDWLNMLYSDWLNSDWLNMLYSDWLNMLYSDWLNVLIY